MIGLMVGLKTGQVQAEDFNTGYILNKMPKDERIVHIDGVVQGIAYTHYFQNNKDDAGFNCIREYGVTGEASKWSNMLDFLTKHPDKPLGGVMFVYLRKKCGG